MEPTQEAVSSFTQTERRQRIERALLAVAAAIKRDDYDAARQEWSSLRSDLEARRSRRTRRGSASR
jgi:hypothetical protein